jgi:pyruvate,water dikinase
VPASNDGKIMRIYLNADLDRALAALDNDDDVENLVAPVVAEPLDQPRQFWRWRLRMAERMVKSLDAKRFHVKGVYLYGSVKNGTAGPDSDIDLLVHFNGDQAELFQLECWFQGWALALSEMNYSRTGVKMAEMLDVTYLSDAEVESGSGLGAMIGAVTNAARELKLSKK